VPGVGQVLGGLALPHKGVSEAVIVASYQFLAVS
jgi:hypothetical protein